MKVPFVLWYGRIMNDSGNDITKKYLVDDSEGTTEDDAIILAPVKPSTDVAQLARNLARRGRVGVRVIMYPAGLID